MTIEEIQQTIGGYSEAAANAKRAGFDGVELHAHMTYLIPQFLNDRLNSRSDEHGGTIENRARFLFQALQALIDVWKSDRVSIKLNLSFGNFGGYAATEQTIPTHGYVITRLNDYPLAYLQLAKMAIDVKGTPVESLAEGTNTFSHFRRLYRGRIIASGGFTQETGNAILKEGLADMVAFALPFIANPDLVERFRSDMPLRAVSIKL
jgi:N-ethylmaleimide reductase